MIILRVTFRRGPGQKGYDYLLHPRSVTTPCKGDRMTILDSVNRWGPVFKEVWVVDIRHCKYLPPNVTSTIKVLTERLSSENRRLTPDEVARLSGPHGSAPTEAVPTPEYKPAKPSRPTSGRKRSSGYPMLDTIEEMVRSALKIIKEKEGPARERKRDRRKEAVI